MGGIAGAAVGDWWLLFGILITDFRGIFVYSFPLKLQPLMLGTEGMSWAAAGPGTAGNWHFSVLIDLI